MNILTKIAVVFLLVLVLVASAVFINMTVVAPNWKVQYEQMKLRADLNAQDARLQKLHALRLDQDRRAVEKTRDDLQAELAKIKQDKMPSAAEILAQQLKGQIEELSTSYKQAVTNNQAMADRNQTLVAQLEEKRKQIDGLQKEVAGARVEMDQTRGKLEREERVVRALQRQLQDRDERIAELERGMERGPAGAPGTAAAATAAPTGKVEGTITAIKGDLASINIGSAQGVRNGNKLYVYRDARFVGYIQIREVDDAEASGIVVDRQLDPLPGDKVTNDLLK